MSVEIKGLDSLRRKLQSLGGELEQATGKRRGEGHEDRADGRKAALPG